MLTGIAVIPAMPRYMPYGWVFVVAVIALILLVFLRVYVIGGRSRRGLPTGPGGGLDTGPAER